MPRRVDHPRASLAAALEIAGVVDELGGDAASGAVAERTGHRAGGAFNARVGAAVKFGWLEARRGRLRTTAEYARLQAALDEAERARRLAAAVRAVPLYARVLDRFAGKPLPEPVLVRVLAREHGLPQATATRVAAWFAAAARAAGLVVGDRIAADAGRGARAEASAPPPEPARAPGRRAGERPPESERGDAGVEPRSAADVPAAGWRIAVVGPGLESTLAIASPADLALARALLDRIERALGTGPGVR